MDIKLPGNELLENPIIFQIKPRDFDSGNKKK